MAKKEMTEEQAELFRELIKLSKRANQRLVRLERAFGKDTWASRKLKNRLDIEPLQAWTKTGRVRVNKSMTITQLRATIKATNQFLNSQTSTVGGIKKVREKQIKSISKSLGTEEVDLTYEDAETLYRMFEDTDFTFFVPQYLSASEFWAEIESAKEQNSDINDFTNSIRKYIEFGNDLDMLVRIRAIYEKYVK